MVEKKDRDTRDSNGERHSFNGQPALSVSKWQAYVWYYHGVVHREVGKSEAPSSPVLMGGRNYWDLNGETLSGRMLLWK